MTYESSRDAAFEAWREGRWDDKLQEFLAMGMTDTQAEQAAEDWLEQNDEALTVEWAEDTGHHPYA